MPGKFCVSLTCAKDDTDKATVALVIANAALGSEKETMVFLSTEGVRVAEKGYVDDVHEEGFMPLKELMDIFSGGGGVHLRMRPVLQEARTRRKQPRGWGCYGGRREAGRVPLGRHPLRDVLRIMPFDPSTGSGEPGPGRMGDLCGPCVLHRVRGRTAFE